MEPGALTNAELQEAVRTVFGDAQLRVNEVATVLSRIETGGCETVLELTVAAKAPAERIVIGLRFPPDRADMNAALERDVLAALRGEVGRADDCK